ncbi:hypothetical protein GCM10011487_24860 [Steroidobacter agaridevorans]|uniref:Uncharacterized protein n=1 Tax=Steroidobacter agaridevorans TaxID=2695856 RepID=A0A829YCX1_9GAMM|nr:hypothetical protein [Steroidobacter agaridevorans]GFE80486.1 hypothetical protein GCM10011487_24860 [Steroidobacter agaridevorans]GFE87542.1 hypothetical protein GCM10011488_24960 [Steroidobacter agaridevorans]
MIEAYAFFAMFVIQIVAMSGLYPAWFTRYARRQTASLPAERLAQLYPGVDVGRVQERFLTRYRAMNIGVAVLGVLLLGWLFNYMQRPDWEDGPVEALVCGYFLVQVLPIGLIAWLAVRFNNVYKPALLEGKRKAVLQRRGLFDFVSPSVVGLAILGYFLFVAFVIYILRDPFPGFAGPVSIGGMTLVYVLQGAVVYAMLYGKKPNPFETHAGRVRTIGLVVKSSVYTCIACVAFVSLNFTLVLLELQRWEPFALSVFFVITALLSVMGMMSPPRSSDDDGLDTEERTTPEARDLPA